jgi:hypothetical protein
VDGKVRGHKWLWISSSLVAGYQETDSDFGLAARFEVVQFGRNDSCQGFASQAAKEVPDEAGSGPQALKRLIRFR